MSDELDFAVVFWVDRGKPAIFEGSEEAVYKWMSIQNNKGMWEVWNRQARTYEPGDEFLSRLAEKYKPKPPLTEEDVRRIVDDRLKEVFTFMVDTADEVITSSETPKWEKEMFGYIQSICGVTRDQFLEGENEECDTT